MTTELDGDVIEAFIHEAWCDAPSYPCPADVGEAMSLVRAALRIHSPCHDATTAPWGCSRGHHDLTTGIPDAPAICTSCNYDDRYTAYPCPTASALGAIREDPR